MYVGISLLALLLTGAAAFFYFVYTPSPTEPVLSAECLADKIFVGKRDRTFLSYIPKNTDSGPALVIVLHGSNINGQKMRQWTGFEFDLMADQYGFIVSYPDGYQKHWNDCREGDFSQTKKENIDDVGFLKALIQHYSSNYHINPSKVYLFGFSNGGAMAFRMATQEPGLIAAIATISTSLPTPETFIGPQDNATPRVMLVNGTADPICPFNGGDLNLFGKKIGKVISAQATAENFAKRNGLQGNFKIVDTKNPNKKEIFTDLRLWPSTGKPFVAWYTVIGGGHVVPQQVSKFPRIMGKVTADLDAPKQAINFFGLQN